MNLPKGHLPKEDCISVIDRIAEFGFEKINFAGGEPTLCVWLPNLIERAKEQGMVTSIVTNGSKITNQWLDNLNGSLDWIGLSIDTFDPEKLIRSGRAVRGEIPITEKEYLDIIGAIKRYGIHLKINTVVTSFTWEEDLTPFIRLAKPERWKIFQALPIKGQNDEHIADFIITAEQFEAYVQRNCIVEDDEIIVVPENNEAMTESYIMVDPAGRFYDNVQGSYKYNDPILKVGVKEALKQVSIDPERFRKRGGNYEW
jgi:radical S-adenosyl methionine domain-containing protein 2